MYVYSYICICIYLYLYLRLHLYLYQLYLYLYLTWLEDLIQDKCWIYSLWLGATHPLMLYDSDKNHLPLLSPIYLIYRMAMQLILCICSHLSPGADLWGRKGWNYPSHFKKKDTGAQQVGGTFSGLPRKRLWAPAALHTASPKSGPAGVWSREMNPGPSSYIHWQKHVGSQRFSVIPTKSIS